MLNPNEAKASPQRGKNALALSPTGLLYLLQVCNSSFPTGAFNHSYGFETWIEGGQVVDGASFDMACRDWLAYGVAPLEGVAVVQAHRLVASGNEAGLPELDHIVDALKLTREGREASFKTGKAFLSVIRKVIAPETLDDYAQRVASGESPGHQAVVFGAAAASLGLDRRATVLSFLHSALANLAGVASRLIPLGQIETQRIMRDLWDRLEELADTAEQTPLHEMGALTAALDVAGMAHERLYTRLCMS